MKIVALDISPLDSGHSLRGVGFYTKKLYSYFLKKNTFEEIRIVFFKNNQIPSDADLVHYPYFDPFFLTLPFSNKKKTIVTVHDLIPLLFPENYPRGVRGELKWQIQKMLLKKSKAIITDSINSKKDIKNIISFPEENIFPIYLAVDEIYRKIAKGEWEKYIREKYNLSSEFILYVGDVNFNKNILRLIQAFSLVKKSNKNIKLVLVGSAFTKKDLLEAKEIRKLIISENLEKEIIIPGYVNDEDLVKLYNLARLYVQPSLYEGFGLPLLEAMACGCPAISSKTSSLPEIGGESILYFDPMNISEISETILKILNNKELNNDFLSKEIIQAKKFNWENTINNTVDIYKKLI